MQRKTILFNNIQLHYNIHGSGNAVLLIHGYGANAQIWNQVAENLTTGYTYIIPELPGSGFSEAVKPVSIEYFANALEAVLQEESKNTAIVIGHSMGGYIALTFADMFPEKIKGLGLIHSHVYADDDAKKAARYKSVEFIERYGPDKYLDEFVPNLFAPGTDRMIIENHRASIQNTPAEGLTADIMAMTARENKENILKQLQVPVLFLMGGHDAIMPLETLMKQTALPRLAQIEILQNSGHMSMLEEPQACAGVINRFLQFCKTMDE